MAWALPGGGGHPLSSSTSQSSVDQKTTTNTTYIVVETPEFVRRLLTSSYNHDVEEDCSARQSWKEYGEMVFAIVASSITGLAMVGSLPDADVMVFEKKVIKLQVQLDFGFIIYIYMPTWFNYFEWF
ncbi:hypothetical protein Ddye_003994 [Dipteronia dyeriana]|uniref:Uncharacterized protein n=1 Tax=Dipteronia dyeriana TaxID=168575 RepID=A0AAD9XU15_9ROSI|nr:hypothetical protein Ddye_003994 [Dipteronia dyeriana]